MDDQSLENVWDALLSREAERVQEMYNSLSSEEKKEVLEHLQRMATEAGWHTEQRASANAALIAIKEINP